MSIYITFDGSKLVDHKKTALNFVAANTFHIRQHDRILPRRDILNSWVLSCPVQWLDILFVRSSLMIMCLYLPFHCREKYMKRRFLQVLCSCQLWLPSDSYFLNAFRRSIVENDATDPSWLI